MAAALRLENDFYAVEIDASHGGITSMYDKRLALELLDTSTHVGNELRSPEAPVVSSRDHRATVELVEDGPVRATVRVHSRIGDAPYECLVSTYTQLPRIDFDLTIDYGSGVSFGTRRLALDIPNFPDMAGAQVVLNGGPGGLSTLFPLRTEGRLFVNQPFGIYETQQHDQFTLDFAAVSHGNHGFCLAHENTPGCFYEGGTLGLTLSRGRPLVVGSQRYRYSVSTFLGDPRRAELFKTAKGVSTPFSLCWPDHQDGRLPPESALLDLDVENVVLSSLYAEGDTIVARFYEMSGAATQATVTIPWMGSADCATLQLDGTRLSTARCTDGRITVDFRPWEIVTIAFDRPR